MSAEYGDRFADDKATTTVQLGPCRCPGTPHADGDSAVVRTDMGSGELKSVYGVGVRYKEDGSTWYDDAAADDLALVRFVQSWNLVDAKGKAVPINSRTVALLDEPTRDTIGKPIEIAVLAWKGSLPNASGAPSADSSPATGSPRRARARR